jgi:hypothetical protein
MTTKLPHDSEANLGWSAREESATQRAAEARSPREVTMSDHRTSVLGYHDRTKHHFHRYAASIGYLDWANQPNPFRRYEGAPLVPLDEVPPSLEPRYDRLFGLNGVGQSVRLDARRVAQLFYDSFALSAWKVAGENRWSLRANPSSGNLHPTEAYLLSGPIEGLFPGAGLCHYTPFEHALELRRSARRSLGPIPCAHRLRPDDRPDQHPLAGSLEVWRAGLPLLPT